MLILCLLVSGVLSQVSPPIGYGSATLEGEGYFQFSNLQDYLNGLLGDPDCSGGNATTTSDLVGIWVETSAGLNGLSVIGGNFYLASSNDAAPPVEDSLYFWKAGSTGGSNYNVFSFDRCVHTENDLYIHVGLDDDYDGSFNAKIGFFDGSNQDLSVLSPISDWLLDGDFSNDVAVADTENVVFEDRYYPITHVWPTNVPGSEHPEIQTADVSNWWGNEAPMEYSFGITQLVDWSQPGEAGPQLYSTIIVDLFDSDANVVVCYNGVPSESQGGPNPREIDPIMRRGPVGPDNLMELNLTVDMGDEAPWCAYCYPEDCYNEEEGTLEFNFNVYTELSTDNTITDLQGVYVTTYIQSGGSVRSSGQHSVCHNWGSFCSPASSNAPTFFGFIVMLGYFLL